MKKKTTAATGKAAAVSTKELLRAIDAASDNGETAATQGKGALWQKLIAVLPELSDIAAEGDASEQKTTVRKCALERAQRFLLGDFTKRELNAMGVEAVYKLMLRFYAELNTANSVYSFYEYFSVWEQPDLRAVLEARKSGGVKVCGEGVDIALKLWEIEDGLSLARDNAEREKMQRQIDELKTRLHTLREEVYEILKRGERRAAQAGAVALEQFNATKDAALKLGAPDMKQAQRERAAQWLIAENAAGHKTSIVDAARHFGNEIEAEKIKGGYEDVESLKSALYKFAEELGIVQFKDRKRGRPRKQ